MSARRSEIRRDFSETLLSRLKEDERNEKRGGGRRGSDDGDEVRSTSRTKRKKGVDEGRKRKVV